MPTHAVEHTDLPVRILTECSETVGFGHLKRSAALARALSARALVELDLLNDTEATLTRAISQELAGLSWQSTPTLRSRASRRVVLDLPAPSQKRLSRTHTALVEGSVALDWFVTDPLPDIAINLLDYEGGMHRAYEANRSADQPSGQLFVGASFAVLRTAILAQQEHTRCSQQPPHVVLSFGGSDPARCTEQALAAMRSVPVAGITVILGPLFPSCREHALQRNSSAAIRCLRDPADFAHRVADADVVFCSGGGTLLEALCLGKPTIVLPQNPTERAHAREHAQAGACVVLDQMVQKIDKRDTPDVFDVFADSESRHALATLARSRVDGQGTSRVAELILADRQ